MNPPWRIQRECSPAHTWIADFWPRIKFFKPPILRHVLWQQPGETHTQPMVLLRGVLACRWADVARGLNKKHKTSSRPDANHCDIKAGVSSHAPQGTATQGDLRHEMNEPR